MQFSAESVTYFRVDSGLDVVVLSSPADFLSHLSGRIIWKHLLFHFTALTDLEACLTDLCEPYLYHHMKKVSLNSGSVISVI